ncbi:hypothetical protein IG631_06920 [Alternaria alternata]|nr:hypothetical protein IG631_06920 [Alternaria alternata]
MAAHATASAGYQVQRRPRCMCPVTVVGRLVEANTIRTGCGAYATRLFIGVQLQVADEIAGLVVEVCEVLGGRLLQGH